MGNGASVSQGVDHFHKAACSLSDQDIDGLIADVGLSQPTEAQLRRVLADQKQTRRLCELLWSSSLPDMVSSDSDTDLMLLAVAAVPSWRDALTDPTSQIDVCSLSEGGGGKTLKLAVKAGTTEDNLIQLKPQAVVFHLRQKDIDFRMPRMAAAQSVWASCDVAPAQIAKGRNWSIDTFGGTRASLDTADQCFAVGQALAKVHSTPVAWFELFRKQLLDVHPGLAALPALEPNNFVWTLLFRSAKALRRPFASEKQGPSEDSRDAWSPALIQAYCDYGASAPRHELTRRVVSVHGDTHIGNFIRLPDGQHQVVDFEFAGVGPAVVDLHMTLSSARTQGLKQHIIAGYLSELGLGAPHHSDIDEICLDCKLAAFAIWNDDVGLFEMALSGSGSDDLLHPEHGRITLSRSFATSVRSSPELQAKLKEGIDIQDLWAESQEHAAYIAARGIT
mmetsp:Transcript_8311/g.21058  ORF Transcript_8311/g.21058 Transcript_8311/m.21058 type:complete len:449 (-) Transcript_8311:161-1507(-)